MFDQLLSQFEDVLSQASALRGPRKQASVSEGVACDVTKPFGAVTSFGKQQRFKAMAKEQLKTTHVEWERPPQKEPSGFTFQKIQRFETEKPKYNETYLNPRIDSVKKNTNNKVPIFKKPQGKDLGKSNVSVSTVASESLRGPGVYQIKDESRVKSGVFMKDSRFKEERQKYEDNPLLVSESHTRRRPPSCAVMRTKTAKNKQLISREQQDDLRERMKLVYWKTIPLEIDRLFKDRRGAVIRQDYFNLSKLSGVQRRCAILMMMDRLNYLRGGYEQEIRTEMRAACAVVYRKSTPKPFKFSQMEPGPDYYHPTDDLIRDTPAAFSFARAGAVPKRPQYDYRDYDIQQQIFKHGGNIIINPEPRQQHRLSESEIKALERGPGFYDCLFTQVERRADIGVVKLQEITDKNDRQNNCIQKRQVNDGLYFPSYQAIDANVPGPLYRDPADVRPAHLPDKVLFPEHWLFYDGDLNKVRAEIAKNVILAKNMDFAEYQAYRAKFNRFKEYLEIQKRGPEVGEYTVQYDAVDKHVAVVDMARQEEKTLIDPIVKPEGHSPGDNLLLDPRPLEDHLPNIEWKKMEGRGEAEIDRSGEPREGDRLVLNPVRVEKHVAGVDFKRQADRPQGQVAGEEGPEGDVLILDPRPVDRHIANVDFARQPERPEIRAQQNQLEEVIPINITEKKTVKGAQFSRLSSVRLVPLLREKKENGVQ